ncbi:MAG: hypothetical protein ABSF43_14190 [Rectinemataceae bacterium]
MTGIGLAMRFGLAAAFLGLTLASPLGAAAQTVPGQEAPARIAAAQPAAQDDAIPLAISEKPENPYSRFEIVSLGSFPIMLFYTGFVFDLGRYAANNFDSSYAPWPFQSAYSVALSDSDRLTRIGAALGASMVVGAIDAYLHAAKLKKAKRLREARESLGSTPLPATGASP